MNITFINSQLNYQINYYNFLNVLSFLGGI